MDKFKKIDLGNGLYMIQQTRDGGRIVIGVLTYPRGGPVPGIIHAQRTISPPETTEKAWDIVQERLMKDYRAQREKKAPPRPDKAVFTKAWEYFCQKYPTKKLRNCCSTVKDGETTPMRPHCPISAARCFRGWMSWNRT